jgi:hypothetical protein
MSSTKDGKEVGMPSSGSDPVAVVCDAQPEFFVAVNSQISLVVRVGARPVKLPICSMECCGVWFRILVSSIAVVYQISLSIACGSLQGDTSIVLDSLDQKTRGFLVQIALPQ